MKKLLNSYNEILNKINTYPKKIIIKTFLFSLLFSLIIYLIPILLVINLSIFSFTIVIILGSIFIISFPFFYFLIFNRLFKCYDETYDIKYLNIFSLFNSLIFIILFLSSFLLVMLLW